ncbi:RNA polymerase factor sigma-54 [Bacillaceae bacterium S4-13-58]
MLDLNLTQQQNIKLAMTPEMKQAISILQYSTVELADYIKREALDNPLIEIEEPPVLGNHYISSSQSNYVENVSRDTKDIYDFLMEQANFMNLKEKKRKIVHYLIMLLDDSGYFHDDIYEIAEELDVAVDDIKDALHTIQRMEPIGVGARNLKECLLIQIEEQDPNNHIAKRMVSEYLEEMSMQMWDEISRELGVTKDKVIQEFDFISSLQPRPGNSINTSTPTNYIVPDLFLEVEDESIILRVNDSVLPKISLSSTYEILKSNTSVSDPTHRYIEEKYRSFMWLSKSINHRGNTLLNIMRAITDVQIEFFMKGTDTLRPLSLKMIAEKCGVHESTVSRSSRNKYVQTPYGLFEIKHFFTNAVQLSDGEVTSSYVVRKKIKDLIDEESYDRPLSDQQLANILKGQHIQISRRTVTKYREQLDIPSSVIRKKIKRNKASH